MLFRSEGREEGTAASICLHDVTLQTGITFQHTDGSGGRRYIVETVASGLATFDYDGDGLIDIYFVNGAPLPGTPKPKRPPRNRLYRNMGAFHFVDVTDLAGVGNTEFGLGVAVGDYDNDGFPDIYVSNYGPNVLYRNNGDGTFTDMTHAAAVTADRRRKVGAGPAFLDIDADGMLDLFVANYLEFSPDMDVHHEVQGIPIYAGPEWYPAIANMLFRNRGDGAFVDVSVPAGIARHLGKGMGMVCADYDLDGDTDIFVNNDGGPGNFLFRNDGTGKFEETGAISGTGYTGTGLVNGSMGVDCGDFDNDGLLDFYVTSYQKQQATLFRNMGDGLFDDVTRKTGAGRGSLGHVTWGCSITDLDNDGLRDIFFACGHLIDNIKLLDDTQSYACKPVLLHNVDGHRFLNVSEISGAGLQKRAVGRGAAFDDLDNDGDVDIVILNSRGGPTVLRNDTDNDHHWLQIQLRGTRSNRSAVGTRVTVRAGSLKLVDEVHAGRGYQSHFGTRLYFGLNGTRQVDSVHVEWLGGGVNDWKRLGSDQRLTLIEGVRQSE